MRRLPAVLVLAILLGAVTALLPAPVLAADDIEITTEARYTVDPGDAVVRVAVTVTAVNRKPDRVAGSGVTRFYFDGVNLGVQPEARRLRATQGGTPVQVESANRDGFRLATVHFLENLYFGETARLRLTFDLPAGAPRSDSDVRVGPAFATFTAWAFGDRGTVRVEVPRAYGVDIAGASMRPDPDAGRAQAWTATAADALEWYAWVTATNDDALTHDRLALADGDEIVIRGWPDDPRWRDRVHDLLRDGVPELVERIGLPWPVDGALEVAEVHTPLLEGYAGFYDPETDRITISEDLDSLTIVHEASHAWFNGDLFAERWISEGLADEYSARVLAGLGLRRPAPERVARRDDAAFALVDWPSPAAIRDAEAAARESYGYAAAWSLMRRIVDRVGEDGMRQVLAAAEAGTIAYRGEGTPELSRLPGDWRRFLDLVEEAEADDAAGGRTLADLFEQWVLTPSDAALLAPRAEALEAYAALVADGGTWAPPDGVRLALDRWAFDRAESLMGQASALLDTRDAIASAAAAEGLDPASGPEAAYQDADSDTELASAAGRADRSLATLDAIADARVAAEAPRDWLAGLGLDGLDPAAEVAAAGDAWEAGDDPAAAARAADLVARLSSAPGVGRNRLIALVAGIGAALVALLIVLLVARRAAAGRRLAAATGPAMPGAQPGAGPERPDPYATLPPDATPAPPAGGPAPGDQGADRP